MSSIIRGSKEKGKHLLPNKWTEGILGEIWRGSNPQVKQTPGVSHPPTGQRWPLGTRSPAQPGWRCVGGRGASEGVVSVEQCCRPSTAGNCCLKARQETQECFPPFPDTLMDDLLTCPFAFNVCILWPLRPGTVKFQYSRH